MKRYWKRLSLFSLGILFVVYSLTFCALALVHLGFSPHDPDPWFLQSTLAILLVSLLLLWGCVTLMLKKIDRIFVEKNARLKRIVAATNHELKTPLTLTMANLDLLEMENGPDELIDDMREETRHMTRLVQKMVELSRVEEGEWNLTFEDVDVSAVVNGCLSGFMPSVRERGLRVKSDIENNVECVADAGELKQIIFVLLDNAIKYCDPDGTVSILLRPAGSTGSLYASSSDHFEIRVENTFSHIDPDEFQHLFDRFYRGKQAEKIASGDGLGLSIALLATKKLGGTIDVYERPDTNAIGFVFTM